MFWFSLSAAMILVQGDNLLFEIRQAKINENTIYTTVFDVR